MLEPKRKVMCYLLEEMIPLTSPLTFNLLLCLLVNVLLSRLGDLISSVRIRQPNSRKIVMNTLQRLGTGTEYRCQPIGSKIP